MAFALAAPLRVPVITLVCAAVAVSCDGNPPLAAQRTPPDTTGLVERVRPLVRRAHSLERIADWREAASVWRRAADSAPPLRHWFLLRAASAEGDHRARAAQLKTIALPATADRAAWARRTAGADLRALLRFGDTTAAVERYLQLGNTRDSVVALSLRERRGETLTDAERLRLARGARAIGDAPMARREYAALQRDQSPLLTAADRYDYALLLFGAGEYRAALPAFAAVRGEYAARAAYHRARTLLRLGRASEAATALREVTVRFPDDVEAAGLAWYLLGDLAADAGRDRDAGAAWDTMRERYPTHALAPRAAFRSAMVQVAAGNWTAAQQRLAPLAEQPSDERNAARYWLARSHAALGNATRAGTIWLTLVREVPDSYYALLAATRLDTVPVVPARVRVDRADAGGRVRPADVSAAVQRMRWLDELGLDDMARDERIDLVGSAGTHDGDARLAAAALVAAGMPGAAIQLAARRPTLAQSAAADDQRLRYPMPFDSLLTAHARANRLNTAFVAALIRQESRFTPTARSAAGALGLMQVMPTVGRSIGGTLGIRPWHDSLLFDLAINVRVGSRHLAAALRREGAVHPAYALAAYNAGRSRMLRWRTKRGAAGDWELFVERIPYVETRDYVRIVLRNAEWYRVLYDAPGAAP